ncbi:T9SS type A sorting domain-containing protein [bacterium]|nr:T9SS type A sorting domain-containing protein [bacterium]
MKKGMFVLFLISLVAVQLQAYDVEDYIPLRVGNFWVMADSGDYGADTSVQTITGTTMMDGYLTYISEEESWGSIDTSFMQLREDGFYTYNKMDDSTYWLMHNIIDPFFVGNSWLAAEMDTQWDEEGLLYNQKLTVYGAIGGFENVTVPAGYFSNCVRLEITGSYHFFILMGDDTVYNLHGSIGNNLTWLAEGVGPVKHYQFDADDSSETFSSLIAYSCSAVDEYPNVPDKLEVYAYPNPFNSFCMINGPMGSHVQVADLSGRVIDNLFLNREGNNLWKPSETTTSGVYLVSLEHNGKYYSTKIVLIK